eukprot:c10358_g1_i1 orf=430-3825(+)
MGFTQRLSELEILQQYRRDRSELLRFILSGGVLKDVVMPPGAFTLDDVDLDHVSVDYVLDCARNGDVLELWVAVKRYHEDFNLPPMAGSGLREEPFPVTNSELPGSSPTCIPPSSLTEDSLPVPVSRVFSFATCPSQELTLDDQVAFPVAGSTVLFAAANSLRCLTVADENGDGEDHEEKGLSGTSAIDLVLDLPPFVTGLSKDDLRETAYEVLLASVGGAGGLISPSKEKTSKLVRCLSRSHNTRLEDQPVRMPGLAGLLESMRIQMEISEANDRRTREALLCAAAGRVGKRMDTLLIPLELLSVVSEEGFPDRQAFLHWKKRQLNVLEEGLLYHPAMNFDTTGHLGEDLKVLIAKAKDAEVLPIPFCLSQYEESLKALRGVATALAEGIGCTDQAGEFCHWGDGYHLNVNLYEMLLSSVFDRLDERQIVEEVEEILELLKSTWRVLAITQTVHDTCYAWVLFKQFALTGEASLLLHAMQQMKRIASGGQRSAEERIYMKNLRLIVKTKGGSQELTYVQSVLIPIKLWADKHLEDYHLHFSETLDKMDALVTIAMIASRLIADEIEQTGNNKPSSTVDMVAIAKQVKEYISSSISLAFKRTLEAVDSKWEAQNSHPLALLAEDVQILAKKDGTMFIPILMNWHPQSQAISASILHQLYHRELKPFIDGVSNLTDDVAAVLSAADGLEEYLKGLVLTVSDEGNDSYWQAMVPYEVEVVASNLIMEWVNIQLKSVLDKVEKAIIEENWDAVSNEQWLGNSIIEVLRIMQETVDQFFGLKLPMRAPILRSLVNGLDNALQLYANRAFGQLGNLTDLIPPTPKLTRYKKETVVNAFSKKKPVEPKLLAEMRTSDINRFTISKLCICLNSLHYLSVQIDNLEEHIKECWSVRRPNGDILFNVTFSGQSSEGDLRSRHLSGSSEEFPVGFKNAKSVVKFAIDRICEFTGTKIIFWDMKELFIDGLYKFSVSHSRIGNVINELDTVLGQLCEMIAEPLRDVVVVRLLQASLNGLLRVLLDGGSSRGFSQSDGDLLEEDLKLLKNFFIADGDGLPKVVVDNTAVPVQKALDLYKAETWKVIDYFKQASGQTNASSNLQASGLRTLPDADMFLHVLCHRMDKEASNFLKKQCKLPKTAG